MKNQNMKIEISNSKRSELSNAKSNENNALSVSDKNKRIETFVSTVLEMLEKYNVSTNETTE